MRYCRSFPRIRCFATIFSSLQMNVDPDSLIPKLPKPRDLQPFPSRASIVFEGHTDVVTCISCSPLGQWLASGTAILQ